MRAFFRLASNLSACQARIRVESHSAQKKGNASTFEIQNEPGKMLLSEEVLISNCTKLLQIRCSIFYKWNRSGYYHISINQLILRLPQNCHSVFWSKGLFSKPWYNNVFQMNIVILSEGVEGLGLRAVSRQRIFLVSGLGLKPNKRGSLIKPFQSSANFHDIGTGLFFLNKTQAI